ncbi:DUF397 domain-containing protein [Streptomyces sp. NEAU-YJ-81]|uniref:DUF397 domain-containing protein n=1 Tax=Streptomyces sp. NEAU-YJ-81 TaxID=2820288 RepID=UPI0024444E31|nr:DUF397 domain-containing protein [Streptomyces sp. NEAU-YJ-81]
MLRLSWPDTGLSSIAWRRLPSSRESRGTSSAASCVRCEGRSVSGYQWRKSSYSANSSNCINVAAEWRKSSESGDASNCVNVAASDRAVLLRESDDPGVILSTTRASLRAFIRGAKDGAFDRIQDGRA